MVKEDLKTISLVAFTRKAVAGVALRHKHNVGSWDLIVGCNNIEVVVAPM